MRIQAIKSNTFLPLAIQLHQYFHALARFLPLRSIGNHWSVIIGDTEYEAVGRGVIKHPYSLKGHHYAKEWNIKLSAKKEREIKKYLDSLVGQKYEFMNFIWHIIRIWFGKWIGGHNDTYSCIELVNKTLIKAGINVSWYDSPYETQVRLECLYGGTVVKKQPGDFFSQLQYWSVPAMKLFATILVIYLLLSGDIFKGVHITNYF